MSVGAVNNLDECVKSAKIGYKIASEHEKKLRTVLLSAQNSVQNALKEFKRSSYYSPSITNSLEEQLSEIERSFSNLALGVKSDLDYQRDNLSKFSITLFGRTMAGKSTLMEILTEGDGRTIGKGAQRTTRDIRQYNWKGLSITDVPGIGAFEGVEDEHLAFDAARTADLILFLITDDAPQAKEAECFSRIVNLGKPVICVMNIKAAISKNIKLTERDIGKRFNKEKLEAIRNQFLQYAEEYGQRWNHIPFVYVHLKSAFLSQKTKDADLSMLYCWMSRIEELQQKIVRRISKKGQFFRIKTFVDMISNPVQESIKNLLVQCQLNSRQGRTILSKKRELELWKDKFKQSGLSRVNSLIAKIKNDLDSEIAEFSEEHFSDSQADKAWEKVLEDRKVKTRCQELIKDFAEDVDNELTEISREIANELKFSVTLTTDKTLKMTTVINGRKIWNWTSTIVSGGLGIASIIALATGAACAGPIGWVAIGAGILGWIGSFFFESREEKEREARIKLKNKLRESVSKMCDKLQSDMKANLEKLISKRLDRFLRDMDKINAVVFRVADTQRDLAWKLNDSFLELNKQIVTEAIKLIGAAGLEYHISKVARLPGIKCLFLLRKDTVFPEDLKDKLQTMMEERIGFVHETDNKKILISKILNIDIKNIGIEEKIGTAYIPEKTVTPNLINRVYLAQQFSEIVIVKQ